MYRQDSSHSSHYTARSVQLRCTAKSHPTAITILPFEFSSVVQPILIPQNSLYRMFSADLFYSKVSSHSIHYTASLVQLCCTDKSYPTAFTILPVQCSSVVQPSLIPQQSIYCQFRAALLYIQFSSHSSHYTDRSEQVCCTTKSHPTAVTILPVLCSYVVQTSLIPQQSLYCQFMADTLYIQVSSLSSHYTASSVQLCCTAKSFPTAVTKLPVLCSSLVQPRLIQQQSLY